MPSSLPLQQACSSSYSILRVFSSRFLISISILASLQSCPQLYLRMARAVNRATSRTKSNSKSEIKNPSSAPGRKPRSQPKATPVKKPRKTRQRNQAQRLAQYGYFHVSERCLLLLCLRSMASFMTSSVAVVPKSSAILERSRGTTLLKLIARRQG